MAQEDDGTKRVAAPYIAYQTLRNFLAPLKEHVIPNRIGKDLMRTMSGATQTQLITALKFLGLIEDDGTPTDALKGLVAAYETDQYPSALETVLLGAYADLFKLSLATSSPSEFSQAFQRAYPCEGETLRKGITFFLNAAREAQVQLSPFLTKNSKVRSAAPRRRAKSNGKKPEPPMAAAPKISAVPVGVPRTISEQLLGKFPEFDPGWTDDLKAKWFEGYQKLLSMAEK
ncbi:DUF5343 domain-containing protein [Methylocella sp.]|uniref:DUF5343 domain-containing protein n=1 Tax=Methylocella sp. TaxID=1978226 RepID=UPI0035AF30AD